MTIDKAALLANRLCVAAALMVFGCSGGSPTGSASGGNGGLGQGGGNGGTKTDAGVAGQSGGDGGLQGSPLTLPGCLSDLLSACPLATPCVYSTDDAGDISNYCFAAAATDAGGGARATVISVLNLNGGNGDCGAHFTLATVVKADGSPCYTFENHEPVESDCTQHTWIWKDASGQTVATGTWQRGVYVGQPAYANIVGITCAVGGAQTSCKDPPPGSCCEVSSFGSAACPDGVNVTACAAGACP